MNKLLYVDFYKAGHPLLMPKGIQNIFGYAEPRGCDCGFTYCIPFGLQGFLKEYLEGQFVTEQDIEEAKVFFKKGFGYDYFNEAGWRYVLEKHNGRLPISIKAAPEGAKIPLKNALVTVELTDEDAPDGFITTIGQYIETMLLRAVWYGTTVATLSSHFKDVLAKYSKETGCEVSPFSLLDFGSRGVSSHESSGIGGAAHLVNFLGSDNCEGVLWAMKNYNTDVCGFSVLANEHSAVITWGKDFEWMAYANVFDKAPDEATVSIVVDSYDDENCIKHILGDILKYRILNRSGKTVFRLDSGNIEEMPAKACGWLWDIFGGTINEAGYKVLNPKVGVLQGDAVSLEILPKVLESIKAAGFAISNVIFGMGGKLLQSSVNRDSLKFAMKPSAVKIGGVWEDVFKSPKGDPSKASKRGRLKLVIGNNGYETVREEDPRPNQLVEVFRNGVLTKEWTFDEVRARANS